MSRLLWRILWSGPSYRSLLPSASIPLNGLPFRWGGMSHCFGASSSPVKWSLVPHLVLLPGLSVSGTEPAFGCSGFKRLPHRGRRCLLPRERLMLWGATWSSALEIWAYDATTHRTPKIVPNSQVHRKVVLGNGLITFFSFTIPGWHEWIGLSRTRLWTLSLLILVRCFLVEKENRAFSNVFCVWWSCSYSR